MDLTNRVEMLETELIAMKLCKLKMEADKTQVELHAKQMEKTLSALQAAHSSEEHQVSAASAACAPHQHSLHCYSGSTSFRLCGAMGGEGNVSGPMSPLQQSALWLRGMTRRRSWDHMR